MRTPVGDRYVVEHMRKHGYNVGGEQSGHIVLSDFVDHRRRPGHRAAGAGRRGRHRPTGQRGLPTASSRCRRSCKNVRYANGSPLEDTRVVKRHRRRQGASSASRAACVIRPSGTEPVIRVMAEGDDERLVNTVVGDIVEAVRAAAAA